MLLPGTDPIHKVTIIPRGMALGLTQQLPIDEKHTYPKHYLENRIAILLGGRIAEDKIFNEVTTGAGNDLERATDMARKMVCEWGMSDKLGPLTFGKKEEQIFLGKEIAQHRNFSESIAVDIDNEIRRIIDENCEIATKLLTDNIETLKRIAENLLERETLDTEDLTAILNGEDLRAQAENGEDSSSEDKKDDLEENKKEEPKENKKHDVVTETES
jgi:cell division protease FtsH